MGPEHEALAWDETLPPKQVAQIQLYLEKTQARQRDSSHYALSQGGKPQLSDKTTALALATRASKMWGGSEPKRALELDEFFLFPTRGRYDFGDYSRGIAIRKQTGEVLRWRE